MPTCSFCKKNYENPRGLTVFTFDGKSLFYCSSKCRNNAKLGRDPKKTNWVKSEKKRNVGKASKDASGPVKKVEEKPKKVEKPTEVKEEKKEEVKKEEKVEEKK